jgi:hypothetical protein
MEHNVATYFRENAEDTVKGFTVIGTVPSSDEYHIAEKWTPNDGQSDSSWVQYHIPADKLRERVESGKCEPVGQLTDEQFAAVCDKVDHEQVTPEKVTA